MTKTNSGKLPSGVQDMLPEECRYLEVLRGRLAQRFEANGFLPVRAASIEYYDTYAHIKSAVPQERMFKFTDGDGRLLVLRPDATLSISRIAATKLKQEQARLYYFSDKWDAREAGGIRGREVYQAGVECLGERGAFSDAQILAFAVESLKTVGLENFIVDIGHVGFFKGILEECGLSAEEAEEVRTHINGKDAYSAERALERAGASSEQINAVLTLPTLFGGAEILERAKSISSAKGARDAAEHLQAVYALLCDMGYADYLRFDLGNVKSLAYYSGIIFSGLVEKLGAPVLSGGRYDKLAGDFGKDIPAVGFALGLKRALIALERQNALPQLPAVDYTVVCERGAEGKAYRECRRLRDEGKRVVLASGYDIPPHVEGKLITVAKEAEV